MSILTPVARIPTSGARAVEPLLLGDRQLLAIPQLARDVAGAPPQMDGGDSDSVEVLLVATSGDYPTVSRLPVPGGEDAEFFRIADRSFLAVANIRAGSGPYVYGQEQQIFEWTGDRFEVMQTVPGFAAKQWRHFRIDGRDFLALAQGVTVPAYAADTMPSAIYEWTGTQFAPFQEVPSGWGYNWHALSIDGAAYLAYADHVTPSLLLRWTGSAFEHVQVLAEAGGRAFADFAADGQHYLLVATLTGNSTLMRWHDREFVHHQDLPGHGGREFTIVHDGGRLFVVRVNFITGTPQDPTTALKSQIYQWKSGQLVVVEEFETIGATDVTSWTQDGHTLVAMSSGLDADARFASHTHVYRLGSP